MGAFRFAFLPAAGHDGDSFRCASGGKADCVY